MHFTRLDDLIKRKLIRFQIYIDGPFGAPASNIFRAEHAVLIATGIGVTPFSSILQSIMHRYFAGKMGRCTAWNLFVYVTAG